MYRLVLPFYFVAFYFIYGLVRLCTQLGIPKRTRFSTKPLRVLFLEPMGPPSAGFRHRSEGWAQRLRAKGIEADVKCAVNFSSQTRWQKNRFGMMKLHVVYSFVRFAQLMRSTGYDVVVVRRELLLYNDYGNLFFEKWLRRIHGDLILDADDDIAAAKREPRRITPFGKLMLEHPAKFSTSLMYYDKVIPASDYLKSRFAAATSKTDDKLLVVPTCVQPNITSCKHYGSDDGPIVIGWIGSSHNFADLNVALPALEKIKSRFNTEIVVVSDRMPAHIGFPVTFIPWSVEDENENFTKLDIGIMPVVDNAEGRGKAGFKLLQYMANGLVSIASAVTVNKEIVEDGVNGFLVDNEADWFRVLENTLLSRERFASIGHAALNTVTERYSYDAHEKAFVDFISPTAAEAHLGRATDRTKAATR